MSPADFEKRIRFLARHYTPVDLESVLAASQGGDLPRRPVLVTFDDTYASVAERAAPICQKYGVPACFFVNGAFLGNEDISLDNLVAYVVNTVGVKEINEQARKINPQQTVLKTRREISQRFLTTLSLAQLQAFKQGLATALGLRLDKLASEMGLYLSPEQVRGLSSSGFEIGNHTFSHVYCRNLSKDDFAHEIDRNRSELENITGRRVRAFSVPYGSWEDLTPALEAHLKTAGYRAVFLVESRINTPRTNPYRLNRVSLHSGSDSNTFMEIEILPRLRTIHDAMSPHRGQPARGPGSGAAAK